MPWRRCSLARRRVPRSCQSRSWGRFTANLVDLRAVFAAGQLQKAIGIVGDETIHAGFYQQAHVGGMVDGPADNLQVALTSLAQEPRRDQIATHGKLTSADFQSPLDGVLDLPFVEQTGH